MAFHDLIRSLIIIQFPIICLSHGLQDVILSPNEFSGKYVKFNRLIDLSTKVPWEEPLKESARIALSSPSVNKDMLLQAPYVGSANFDPSAFGDIVILAKGKLKKFANDTYLFEEIHDVCEYQCQNNADKYLENVTALWMVERIRHRDVERQYRYDLKFTIVPIFSGRNALIKSNNLEERLRNILKKTFILRDTDYPKYFQQIVPKISRRADVNRSMPSYVTPNHLMHHAYSYSHPPKMNNLNMGEFMKKQAYVVPKPQSPNNYYVQNINRYPIRFPDSRENFSSLKSPPYRVKLPIQEEEERQEAHIVNNVVDHRGAVDLSNKQTAQSFANFNSRPSHSNVNNSPLKPLPARSTGLFMSQPAILLPQMPISLFHVAPYTIPLHLQVSTPANQMLYAQQHDVTTFRYPNFLNSHQAIPQFQYLQNKSNPFKESERIIPQQSYSLPDPVYHSTSTSTEKPIYPTQYTPKLSNYVTASSIQINSYDNNEFQPIVSPFSSPKNKFDNKKIVFSSDEKIQSKTTKYQTRHATNSKERFKSTTTTQATTSSSTTDFPQNYDQLDYANYDIVATRPSVTKKTTAKPILKWLPKRHRNKTSSNVITTLAPNTSTFSASIESTSQSTVHPTIKASTSTHSQIFRGRNRFYSNNNHKRNSSTSTVTEKSTTLSSNFNLNQNLSKQFKRKLTQKTTLLPIATTQSPINAQTTTAFPTYSVTSFYETKEPITSQSYSTSVSLQADGDKIDTTASSSYELLPASVETINSNSTNINIYRASEDVDVNDDRLNIDAIASTILKHAKSTDNVKKPIIKNKE